MADYDDNTTGFTDDEPKEERQDDMGMTEETSDTDDMNRM
jgi:hypothetical protein